MTLDEFPEVRKSIINFASTINTNDFSYFTYVFYRKFGDYNIPVYLKLSACNGVWFVEKLNSVQFGEIQTASIPDIKTTILNSTIYCWLKDTAPVKYSNNTEQNGRRQKVVKIEFVGNVSSKVQGYVLREIEKQYSVELSDKYETTFDVEMEYSTYYMFFDLHNPVKVRLSFEPTEKQNKLIFKWRPSAGSYLAEFDNGIKSSSLGFVTVAPEAAKALKAFGKECDGSYGNPNIARRMKKYLNL